MRAVKLHILMLHAMACALLLFPPVFAYTQAETHNFTTYDTVISLPQMGNPFGANDQWNVRISRPVNMFTAGNPDTASRPAIIMMPGIGEQGNSNTANLVVYGPHYWLNNGWDGSVMLGNGKHYPILMTISYINGMNPTAPAYYGVLSLLLNTYHIKRNSVHLTGLSQGAFTNGALIEFEITAGAESGMKLATSEALFEGLPDPLPAPYSTWSRDTVAYKVWAAKYHGRYFFLEGNGSDNFRDGWHISTAINDTVPGAAYFSYEDLGGGSHCCWNSMYDPSATNWTSVGTLGPNNTPSQTGTNTMGDYSAPSNVFQWELRQGDTTMVGGPPPAPIPPPTVSAGTNQNITLPTNSVTLTGTASEVNGTIASYAWTELSGPAGTITTPAAASTTVTGMLAGTYVFQLQATDGLGNPATSTVQVVVNPAPAPIPPPTVSAGTNQNITLPTNSVTLTGTASEVNGTIASYAWTELSGPADAITTPAAASTTVTGLTAGTYVYQLLVTDGLGNTATSTVQVVVNPAIPPAPVPPPIVSAGTNQNITLPTNSVTLAGTASELNGTIASYAWNELSGPAGVITTPAAAGTTVTSMVAGTYVFQLLATDGLGNTATSTIQVVVNPAAAPPPAPVPPPIVSAGTNQNITLPTDSVTLNGTASELNGTIASYAWTELSGPAGAITTPSAASTTVTGMVAGTYVFQLLATDGLGNTATSTVQVVVNPAVAPPPPPAPVPPPIVSAGTNQNITLPTDSVTLAGTASELNGTIASYAWTELSGPAGVITTPAAANTTVTSMVAGTYVFQLLATDGLGNTATSTMQVVVNPAVAPPPPPPPAPVPPPAVSAGSNQTITLPTDMVTLTGNASELNGTIASYAWSELSGPVAAVIGTPSVAGTIVTGLSLSTGTYTFQLLVTDGLGNTATSTVQVVVNPAVAPPPPAPVPPPIVSAGTDQNITLPTNSVTLAGTASELNGTIASYAWTELSGPAGVITTPSAAGTTITNMVAGTYVFQLLATDGLGNTATSTVQVVVSPAVAPPPPPPPPNVRYYIDKVVVAEYRTWYIMSDSTIWAFNNGSPHAVQLTIGAGLKTIGGSGGFNYFRMLDTQGYLWTDLPFNISITTNNATRMDTDTTGAPFSGNWYVNASGHVYMTIRADSSVWYGGKDAYSLFYPGGDPIGSTNGTIMSPTQISPAGMKFKKVLFGGSRIVGLTTSGQVYQWVAGGGRTPTQMTIPRPATDIFVSQSDVAGCIIPDPGEGSGMGYPYVWGTSYGMWGGGASYAQPTSIKALWNMSVPIKEIAADWNTIHYIDSLGRMYGTGYNPFGEVGNGQEFINKYNYPGFPGYGWDFGSNEDPTGAPVQLGAGITWKHLYSNNWFGFYKYAQDVNDSVYSWGRNKGLVLGNGMENLQEQFSYDAMDVLKPTMVHPTMATYQTYNFTPPSISVGPKQVVAGSTANLSAVVVAPLLFRSTPVAANGIDKAGYDIVSYQWTQVSGTAATITSPTTVSTSVTGLSIGTYIFQLITTDNNTGTLMARDTIIVTATVPGPLLVNAGSNQTITLPTNSVSLLGTASEVNGTVVSYQWSEVSGPTTAAFGSAGQAGTSVTGLGQGIYRFQLLVTDALGITATASVQVTVNPAPVVPGTPSANAGSDQTITLPTNSVTLTGGGTETNGTIVSYHWAQTSGPSTATLGSAGAATTSVTGLVQGVYAFQLTVTDALGVTATDVTQVTVNPSVPVSGVPIANAGVNQTITLPTNSVTLTGSGSEVGGTIVSYQWTQISGPTTATIVSAGSAQTLINNLGEGTYRFQLLITDALGVTATATVQVTVNPAVIVPGTPSANAGSDQTITLPANSVTLSGSGSETNGTIVAYQWTQISGPPTYTITTPGQAQTTVTGLVLGTYTFQLTVTDNSGLTATDVVHVTVDAAGHVNQPPVADAGPDQTTSNTAGVSLDGSASYDPDGTIVGYEWVQISGAGGVTLVNSNSAHPTLYGLQPGAYVFELTVTDNNGATATADVTITVTAGGAGGQSPVAIAGSDTTVYYPNGNTAILDGSASYDQSGTIMSYSWTQVSGPAASAMTNPSDSVTTVSQLAVGTYVFQLTVTDNNNMTSVSTVRVNVLDNDRHSEIIQIYPNPAVTNGQITVTGTNQYTGNVKFNIFDISGRFVKEVIMDKTATTFSLTVPLQGLSRGAYVLEVEFQGASKPEMFKIIID